MKILVILVVFVFFLYGANSVDESSVIEGLIEDLKKIKVASKGVKLSKIDRALNDKIKDKAILRLDLDAMIKSVLSDHYSRLSVGEVKDFKLRFKKLMLKSLSKGKGGDKLKIKVNPKEKKLGNKTYVLTVLSKKGEEDTEINYIFIKGKIVDVTIDDESITSNFREQFGDVIKESGFKGLIKLMDKRLGV